MFPEGKVNLSKKPMRLKWGVGRMIADCKQPPVVLPFFHLGFDDILPATKPLYPRVGKVGRRSLTFDQVLRKLTMISLQKATILFGEPLDFATQLARLRTIGATAVQIFTCHVGSVDFFDSFREKLESLLLTSYRRNYTA